MTTQQQSDEGVAVDEPLAEPMAQIETGKPSGGRKGRKPDGASRRRSPKGERFRFQRSKNGPH